MRVLSLDVGEKRIGLALSDPTGLLATPLTTIVSRGNLLDVKAVLDIATRHDVGEIIVGLPISLSGHQGKQAKLVVQFIKALAKTTNIPLRSLDERYSSVEAKKLLRDSGIQPSRNKSHIDAAAAAVILQSYLDSNRTNHT